ncbi:MAG: glycosyltransferase family 2 protein [Dermatophilaceae bacterium]
MTSRVHALVVLYDPDPALLQQQWKVLSQQVDRVVYVDNGGGRAALGYLVTLPQVTVLGDGSNVGLAQALNDGLMEISATGATHAVMFDQDTLPDPMLVATLGRGFDVAPRVAAVGPSILDELRGRPEYFTRLRLPLNHRITQSNAPAEFFDVDFLITSGTLVSLDALNSIGSMDSTLFIDCIDFEWSFRTRSRGWRILATYSAMIRHRRGDTMRTLPGGFGLRLHSPTRLFYMHRNRVDLYRRAYVPMAWKVHDVGRLVVKLALIAAFGAKRRESVAAAVRGMLAGVRRSRA